MYLFLLHDTLRGLSCCILLYNEALSVATLAPRLSSLTRFPAEVTQFFIGLLLLLEKTVVFNPQPQLEILVSVLVQYIMRLLPLQFGI